jgi:hypothetical protein
MFKKIIKEWLNFESATREDFGDITVDIARAKYKEYEQGIKKQQEKYIKQLCEKIKCRAKAGKLSVTTLDTNSEEFVTYDFLQELIPYFTSRGFKVEEKRSTLGIYKTWLRISWEDDNNEA